MSKLNEMIEKLRALPKAEQEAAAAEITKYLAARGKAGNAEASSRPDPELEAESVIAIIRGTTFADDREYFHTDYHWDRVGGHTDIQQDFIDYRTESHTDIDHPHLDSKRSGGTRRLPSPLPHVDLDGGHLDERAYHQDRPKGDHVDIKPFHVSKNEPAVSEHHDLFKGHLDLGHIDLRP